MKGSVLLKVISILMLIGGAGLLLYSFLEGEIFDLWMQIDVMPSTAGNLYAAGRIIRIAGSFVQIAAGILGIVYCKQPQRVKVCILFGFFVLVLQLVAIILPVIGLGFDVSDIIIILAGIALPILYLIGAFRVRSNA